VTYKGAAEALREHYRVTCARDLTETEWRLAHLDAFFAECRPAAITTRESERYAIQRQEAGTSNASINRELAVLGRMLRLAYEHNRLARVPKFTRLSETAPRAGFVDQGTFETVRSHLPADLQVAVTIAYTFGWRRNEVLRLSQRHLDLKAGTLRLDPGSTKNKDGWLCYLTPG